MHAGSGTDGFSALGDPGSHLPQHNKDSLVYLRAFDFISSKTRTPPTICAKCTAKHIFLCVFIGIVCLFFFLIILFNLGVVEWHTNAISNLFQKLSKPSLH
ncbi:hypothetical protein BBBOND_0304210 [Babesia bigemina]|uniref:Uncharacterized protein n=1 Tax=Babesia bigemina TaxID=5866 RepID=A0A061D960_BABBI|nr:hypothetical protein BBBOND_0304210 [Babesia bigemina]CDR96517.1 hypothetical protein BBBOND_0304210 [Babesia bigemina]|eukprot:XP_012768703.1 hypothetical protein BBBOND_0304210 [Babesia bigemina]